MTRGYLGLLSLVLEPLETLAGFPLGGDGPLHVRQPIRVLLDVHQAANHVLVTLQQDVACLWVLLHLQREEKTSQSASFCATLTFFFSRPDINVLVDLDRA